MTALWDDPRLDILDDAEAALYLNECSFILESHLPMSQVLTQTAGGDRTREILASIKTVFQQKGFDGASMQDLARAASMSAGNFYRYFASKDAIIAALVENDLREVADTFRHILQSDDPRGAFLRSLRRELDDHHKACDGPLWAEIDAAAVHRPEIAVIIGKMEREILRYLLETFALITGRPPAEMQRFTDHAWLVVVIFKGIASQPRITPSTVDLAVETVDLLLDRIVSETAAHPSDQKS